MALAAVVAVAAGFGAGTTSPAEAQVACALVPQLRDVTINQGLGSYPRLTRGKDTLVKFYLSLPDCAPAGSSIVRTGGSMQMRIGSTVTSIQSSTPAPTSTAPPPLAPFTAAPALDSTGDPVFVVPGALLTSSDPNTSFSAAFTATINYSSKTSSTALAVPGVASFSTRPGSTSTITATVDKRSNALRVLLVPMGDPTQAYDSQFSDAARKAAVNAMTTVSRVFPVPAGTSELGGTAGLRYTINPSLLDIRSVMSGGQFCGTGANFESLKGPLAATLLAWNTKNPTKPADRVVGLVDVGISPGASCADGFGAVGGTVAWARAIPATATTPSRTGAVISMELGHTLGLVPRSRSLFTDPYHSPNQQADVTAVNRGYNVARRSFLADDHTAMRVSGAWNNDSVLLEKDDWGYLLCALGGSPGGGCTTSGVVGSATGVASEPTFVISGTTDGTTGGTSVVNSYFSPGAPRSEPVTGAGLSLVQLDTGGGTLRTDPVAREVATSEHEGDNAGSTSDVDVFSAAVPFDTNADRIELRSGATVLYARDRTAPPVGGGTTVDPGTGTPATTDRVSLTDADTQASAAPSDPIAMSDDGRYVMFNSGSASIVSGDTNSASDVFRRDRQTGASVRADLTSGGGQIAAGATFSAMSADGNVVAFASTDSGVVAGDTNATQDVFVRDLTAGTTERVSVSTGGTEGNGSSFAPSVSTDGRYVTFTSGATNLVTGDTNGRQDVFLRDRQASTTVRVSVDDAEGEVGSDAGASDVSGDGSVVAFATTATLDPGDTNNGADVYLRDPGAGTTELVSRHTASGIANAGAPSVDADGSFVAFPSDASDHIGGDTNGTRDVFVYERATTSLERVNLTSGGAQQTAGAPFAGANVGISADGRFVSFSTSDSDLVSGDNNGLDDVYVHDRQDGTTERVSVASDGSQATGPFPGSRMNAVDADGRLIAFTSAATNLVAGDTNSVEDVFVRDRGVPGTGSGDAVGTSGTDDNPADARVDLFLDCGDGTFHPIAVGLEASEITGNAVDFAFSFDPAVSCTGGQVSALLNDGFSTASTTEDPVETDPGNRDPLPAIAQPTADTTITAYDAVTLQGAAKDAEDGQLFGSALSWTLDGNGAGTGPVVDLSPPSGGWSAGDHTATLTADDGDGGSASTSVTFTVLGDADNDGVPTGIESGCGGGSDSDPADAYADADADGIGNADDVTTDGGPCTAETSYTASVDVTPNSIDRDVDDGPVQATLSIPFQTVAAVEPSSVRIASIGGLDVSGDSSFVATSFTVSGGVATATFDRAAVNAFLQAHSNESKVPFVVSGRGPGWTFEGTDTVAAK